MPDTGTLPTGIDRTAKGIMANSQVTKGDGTSNRVSLAVDMNEQAPGKWVVLVGEIKGDTATGDVKMGELAGSASFTVK
jgi:hypothetical protein